MAKRGRPPKIRVEEPALPPREIITPPIPAAEPTKCASPIEAMCDRFRLQLTDIKRYEDGGDDLELTTIRGVRLRVKRAELLL